MKNPLRDKSFAFALRIVRLAQHLQIVKKEWVLSKQLLRSGTSIGAMVREAGQAESRADFIHKMAVGLKEADESQYWIELLYHSGYMSETAFQSINYDCTELLKLLTSTIKTVKSNR